jgi:DNA modification methylase
VLEIKEMGLSNIKPWDGNPRKNDHAVEAVAESVRTYGFNVPIICDQNFIIVAGHTRWKAAQKLGLEKVPVIIIEMDEVKRRAFAIADNKTGEIADWDLPKLKEVLEILKLEDVDIKSLGFSNEELRRLLIDDSEEEDIIPDIDTDSAITKYGDLYVLGNHRLLCGDSRNPKEISVLTEGIVFDHVFGGPPYFNQREYSHWNEYTLYINDMKTIIINCCTLLKEGSVCVWNIANGCSTHHDHVSHHSKLFEESGFQFLDTIIWKKTGANYAIPRNFHIQRNSCYYPALEWEALLVYQKPGSIPKMTMEGKEYMSRFHTNVWEIPAVTNQIEVYGHPAVCPVEIPYRSILAYTGSNASIFEPFGGSGTTLIAAEKTSRKAYVMEMNPIYCDRIVKRWENITGDKANKLSL